MLAIIQLQQKYVRFQRRTYTPFRCRAPCRGLLRPADAMGSCTPQTPCVPAGKEPRFASVPFLRVRYRQCQIGAHVKNVSLTFLGFCRGSV